MKDIPDTWLIHDRINQYLISSIDEAFLQDMLTSKGRNVAEQIAHIHNVRLMWLKASAPELYTGLSKIEKGDPVSKASLLEHLQQSGRAIHQLLEKGLTEGKIKGFKPHPTAFLGYLIAHESHHRSQVIIALKQSGHKVDQKILFGLWEWGSR